jgi:hypothetical protein
MGALARRRGASALAAGGSSVMMQVMSVVTGIAVALVFGATSRGAIWGGGCGSGAARRGDRCRTAAAAAGVHHAEHADGPVAPYAGCTPEGGVDRRYHDHGRLAHHRPGVPDVLRRARRHAGGTGAYVAVYAASYVAGFIALFAPGGIGVREGALVATMERAGLASPAEAAVIAVASRIWLTVLEIVPGLIALAIPAGAERDVTPDSRGG